MTTLREETLENGLRITFTDESNRYFGDYHRICVIASIECDLPSLPVSGEDALLKERALEKFGDTLTVTKRFERMGVASADVDRVRIAIIEDFLRHAAAYLSRAGYPLSLVKAELKRKPVPGFYA